MSLDLDLLGGPYETVIDVGAFRGDFALACLARWPEARVLSFEPLEKRPRRIAGFRRRWTWYPCALGAIAGPATMHRNEFIPSSSMLPMAELHREAFPYTRQTTEVEVGMAMLDEFFEQITEPALLKIDVQGFEKSVLFGATEVLPLCSAVVCEVSHETLYEGAATPEELDLIMRSAGFAWSARIDELRHPQDADRLLQSDELWVRS